MMDTYAVNESVVEISLCVLLEIEIEKSVDVEIRTENGTATGKGFDQLRDVKEENGFVSLTAGEDYAPLNSNVSFGAEAASHTMCTTLSIHDDRVLESDETVIVLMETKDPRVLIPEENHRATVVISDNDDGQFNTLPKG